MNISLALPTSFHKGARDTHPGSFGLEGAKILLRIVRCVHRPLETLYRVDFHDLGGVVFKGGSTCVFNEDL